MVDKRRQVAVIGGGQASSREVKLAEEVGRLLARKGVILVFGGLCGIMEAACRGSSAEGGLTIGILPGESRRGEVPPRRVGLSSRYCKDRGETRAGKGRAAHGATGA